MKACLSSTGMFCQRETVIGLISTQQNEKSTQVLRKIRNQCQAHCTTYKMHAMATHHRGAGHPLDRGLDILTEDPEHIDIDNDSTHNSDDTVALGSPDAVGHPEDLVCDNQDRLTALIREIKDLPVTLWIGIKKIKKKNFSKLFRNYFIGMTP